MATRSSSRRSAGDSSGQLNPAMIHLLDTSRLRSELQARGLSTTGRKDVLADRLSDAVSLGHLASPIEIASPSPKKTRKKPASTPVTVDAPSADSLQLPQEELPVSEEPPSKKSKKEIGEKTPQSPKKKKEKPKEELKEVVAVPVVTEEEEDFIEEGFSITFGDLQSLLPSDAPSSSEIPSGEQEQTEAAVPANDYSVSKKKKRRPEEERKREAGIILDKGDSEWQPEEKGKRKEKRKEIDLTEEGSSSSLFKKSRKDSKEVDRRKSMETAKEEFDRKERSEKRRESFDGYGTKKEEKREKEEKKERDEKKEKDEKREKGEEKPLSKNKSTVTAKWAEYIEQQKLKKAAEGKGTAVPVGIATENGIESENKKSTEERKEGKVVGMKEKEKKRVSFGLLPKKPSVGSKPSATPQAKSSAIKVDLLDDIFDRQSSLLQNRPLTVDEAELERVRIEAELRQRTIERQEEQAREERIRQEKERERQEREEKERERRERERKLNEEKEVRERARALLMGLPIPGPPKGPKPSHIKKDGNEDISTEMPTKEIIRKESPIPPPFEPIEEEEEVARPERPSSSTAAGEAVAAPDEASSQFLSDLNLALLRVLEERAKKLKEERSWEDNVEGDVRQVLDNLLTRTERRLEKELRWARTAKRRSPSPPPALLSAAPSAPVPQQGRTPPATPQEPNVSLVVKDKEAGEAAEEEDKGDKIEEMLKDPRALLEKATQLLKAFGGDSNGPTEETSIPSPQQPYEQIHVEPGSYEEEKEERTLPEFHGEPVPSDDDDALFEQAAGIKKEKKPKHPVVQEEAPPSHEHVLMDYYNADLHVKCQVEKDGKAIEHIVEPDNTDGLALMWGGVKTNYGVLLPIQEAAFAQRMKLVFQVKILEHMSTRHLPFTEADAHDIRVGFSLRCAPNILGEFANSYCYTATGRKATDNVFLDYGDPCEVNDVITAAFDLQEKKISYWKNSTFLGVAFSEVKLPEGEALYPHIALKNTKAAVNLGDYPQRDQLQWPLEREEDWIFPREMERIGMEMSRLPPGDKTGCTLLMMVGLPGVGKTTWVRQYLRGHPNETWSVINSETVMAAMKVNGKTRSRVHFGRWDMVLGLVAKAMQKLIFLAARRRRNYIIDLTNVSRDSRKRRLFNFQNFQKKCIVIIPEEEEMIARQQRQARQEGVSLAPPEAMLEMKAVFSIPNAETEGLEEVHFIEPPIEMVGDAIDRVEKFNSEGRPWYQKRYRGRGGRRGGGPLRALRRDGDMNRFSTPLSVSTSGLNGSGPPSSINSRHYSSDRRSHDSPATSRSFSGPSPHSYSTPWMRK